MGLLRKILSRGEDKSLMLQEGPWMDGKEVAVIEKYLKPSDTMLEWGSGGSTLHFSKLVSKYYAIEHNKNWYKQVKKVVPENVSYMLVQEDAKRTRPTQYAQFETYIEACSTFGVKFDKVLIDGRARPECAIYVLPHLNKGAVVFIHDYFSPKRPHYRKVEEHYDIIDEVKDTPQTLVVLRPKHEPE
jgi:hypothetical protein